MRAGDRVEVLCDVTGDTIIGEVLDVFWYDNYIRVRDLEDNSVWIGPEDKAALL